MQQPLDFMIPKTEEWTPPEVSSLPSWRDAKRVSVDLETKDPQLTKLGPGVRRDGRIVGVAFAIEDGPAEYLPIGHQGGGNCDADKVLTYLRDQAKVFRGDIAGANLGYDLDYLEENGVHFRPRFHRDVQIAEPLIDELQFEYGLEAIAERYGIPGKDDQALREAADAYGVHPKKELWKLPARFVASYAIQDVLLPLQLLRRQERKIDEEDLWKIYDMESRLLPILVKMRRRGVRVDLERVEKIELWSIEEERAACEKIYDESNVRIGVGEINRDELVVHALKAVGIELKTTTAKGNISVAGDVLDALEHPVADAVLRARKFNKLRGTFCQSIRDHEIDGRIHCTLNQLRSSDDDGVGRGTVSGRLSCTDPNLQQQPSRDPEIAPRWRAIYRPEDGEQWACLDYSQQEPRWVVHFAEVCRLRGAREAAERYRRDPNTDNHTLMAQIIAGEGPDWTPSKKQRSEAKIIFLGLCYGMGGAKLCRGLGYETTWTKLRNGRWIQIAGPEGQAVIDDFDANAPFVRKLAKKVENTAKKRGWIQTVLGRRCRFPRDESGRGFDWTHKALNRLIQGSSADQTKKAMIDADDAGYPLLLQVHDELDLSVPSREYADGLAQIMRTTVDMNVPAKVDVEVGPSWGEVE